MLNSDNDEVWKDVGGYEGRYMVSNMGRVASIQDNHGRYRERLVAANVSGTVDYLYVKLFIKDAMKNLAVHRLVAIAFVPNPHGKPMVNHIDGDKRNNRASNLEWVTCSENHRHAGRTGLRDWEHVAARQRGAKVGTRSRFHNVSWDAARGRWKASVKDKGKMLRQKRFRSEVEAALYVNHVLDEFGLTNRPRNVIAETPNDYPDRE